MSGGKPVFVSETYSLRSGIRWASVNRGVSGPMEETSFSRRSLPLEQAGQVSMGCSKDSCAIPHWGKIFQVFIEQGGVAGQVAFGHSPLRDTYCQMLTEAHEGLWREGGGFLVVWRGGDIGGPVLEEQIPSAGPEGLVGSLHGLGGGNLRPGWRGVV